MKSWPSITPISIDRTLLHEYSDGDRNFEQELLHLFVDDTQQHLARLKAAISNQNFDMATREAHHIKGASAHVGAVAMFAIAAEIETLIKQKSTSPSLLLSQLETAYQDVIGMTEQWDQESTTLS
ncbi:Hpt domain-containing protein [Acaryochloris sp. CCMEE 5410]|uniref:Hpt domain-containing protein n=1 Tax=Acaryochloris sp. CCMEE 5410 TaxID=310037 RepID=UPI0002484753|nr:Hpt domain-containing protein [Acaryochloris sp. CCMEE 5410]KAI9131511.1 Hpt domain-containing protein [Acaryochloris sp. CCMEE 5410]